jgi:hypothetical protein
MRQANGRVTGQDEHMQFTVPKLWERAYLATTGLAARHTVCGREVRATAHKFQCRQQATDINMSIAWPVSS